VIKENSKLREERIVQAILFSEDSVTDYEKNPSLIDSFVSDISQSKNFISKEILLMRKSSYYQAVNAKNYQVRSQSAHSVNNADNPPSANSMKRREIDSNVIN